MRRGVYRRSRTSGLGARFLLALGLALFSVFSYFGTRSTNPVTGETQFVDLSVDQEIALGLQAAPQMASRHGGLHPDERARALVERVGRRLLERSSARETPYRYDFHLLADGQTVNAFALPGGQIFITAALLSRLETEGQLAGVLGHEIAHVVARHGAEHLAKQKLSQGLTQAVGVAAEYSGARLAAAVGQLISLQYGRDDELESDRLGLLFMSEAGYNPNALKRVMEILAEASGGARQPEFLSSHPDPGNRIGRIDELIVQIFPNGVPANLEP